MKHSLSQQANKAQHMNGRTKKYIGAQERLLHGFEALKSKQAVLTKAKKEGLVLESTSSPVVRKAWLFAFHVLIVVEAGRAGGARHGFDVPLFIWVSISRWNGSAPQEGGREHEVVLESFPH
jgi:hypothetical protein